MTEKMTDRIRKKLGKQIGDEKVVSSGDAYERSRKIWNARVMHRPDLIVLCENTADVQAAIKAATIEEMSISVRAGGHDWPGRCIQGQLVLDVTRLNEISIADQTCSIGGGTLTMDLAEVTSAHGLLPVTGIIGGVGVTGLALGGGYGHFTAKFGLASDNILGAEVVLADGRVVQTDANQEPDLFWAIRGGGGNFGVVTRLRLQLHKGDNVIDGAVVFPWEEVENVFRAYNSTLTAVPDELTLKPFFFPGPDGGPSIVLQYTWYGDGPEHERMLETVKQFGRGAVVRLEKRNLAEILREAEKRATVGISWITRTVTLPQLSPEAIDIIKRAMERRPSPRSWIASHPARKSAAKKAKRAVAKKPAPRQAKKAAPKKQKLVGEGDYAASKTFLKDQADFVKKNKSKIPAMGKEAEQALNGPEGDSLRAAEQEAMNRSTIE
jgi:hypothetical protein